MAETLSPHDIAQWLQDIGRISHGEAHRLEQRVTAWAAGQKAEGQRDGIVEAARKAKFVVAGSKSHSMELLNLWLI